jgi:ribosome biogenesis GTPase
VTTDTLSSLGWAPDRDAELARAAPDLQPGRVCLEHNHVYRVRGAGTEWLAEAAGRLKYRATGRHELPAVGDWVLVRPDATGGRAVIQQILERRTWFSRKSAGRETTEQVIAANIDVVLIVFGLDVPVNTNSIERYLVVARQSGARPAVVLNKGDLVANAGAAVAEAAAAAGDAPVHAVSSRDGTGMADLEAYLSPGVTLALLGPSGAGKSSIVNALVGREALATGAVRDWDARGRHTSVHRQLVVREEGGLIIDTPGMRELQLWETAEPVGDAFADIVSIGAACRFRDCRHNSEPGCAVKAGVEAGTFPPARYESYLKLQGEQEALGRKLDERALLEAKRQARTMGKALKAMQKDRDR